MKYIDTSAFVKYYVFEEFEKGSDKIKKLIDIAKAGNEKLISSILLIPECISAFDKRKRRGLLTREDFDELLAIFVDDLKELVNSDGIVIEGINSFAIIFSVDYVIKHSLAVNDASHLYSALLNKNEIEQFISADENLLKAAKLEGFNVSNPEESL